MSSEAWRGYAARAATVVGVWLLMIVVLLFVAEGVARLLHPLPPVAASNAALDSHPLDELPPLYRQFPQVEAAKLKVALWHRAPYVQLARTPSVHVAGYNINHDSLGFRGPEVQQEKPPTTFRILVVGGSVAWGSHAVGDETTFWGVLAQRLSAAYPGRVIEVVSAGTAGWNSTQELIDLQLAGLSLQPDLVLVFDGYNDFYQPLSGGAGYMQPFGYREYDQLADFSISHPLQFWLQQRFNSFVSNSALLRGRFVTGPTAALQNLSSGDAGPQWDKAAAWLPELERRYLANLSAMATLVRAHGAKIVLVTQPNLLLQRSPVSPEQDLLTGNIETQRQAARAFHSAVTEGASRLADGRSSWYLDYTGVFQDFSEATYFDLVHPLSNGHARIGEALFQDIERLHLLG